MLGNKALRSMENTLYGNRKQHNENRDFCFIYFIIFLFTYQKTKKHAKHYLWRKRKTLYKSI